MEKIFSFILCLSMLLLCACGNTQNENETTTESTQAEETTTQRIKTESLYDEYKYRSTYYSIPYSFVELVGEEVFWEWYDKTPYRVYPLNVDEMAMVAFIKKFNISREDFDKANEKRRQTLMEWGGVTVINPAKDDPYYDRDIENCELYDGDLIYTFDNELINAYYLYVDPYEDESSTVGDGVLDVPNVEITSEPVSETATAEIEISTTAGDGFLDVPNEENTTT